MKLEHQLAKNDIMLDQLAWILFAFLSAIFHASTQVLSKYNLSKKLKPESIVTAQFGLALPFLFIFMLFREPYISNHYIFWLSLFISGTLNVYSTFLVMKDLKVSPISLSIPFLSFTPIFILFIDIALKGKVPNTLGIIGVITIVAGSYLININKLSKGLFEPFKYLFSKKDRPRMLLAAFLFSIVATFAKISMLSSNTQTFIFFFALLQTIIFIFFSKVKIREIIFTKKKSLWLLGISQALTEVFSAFALISVYASYALAVKRMSLLFSVLSGYFFFEEKNLQNRLLGAIVMIVGIFILTLS